MIAHQPALQLIKYVGHICCQLNTRVEQWGSVESVWLSPAAEICGNMLSLGCALAPTPQRRAVRTNIGEESWAEPNCSRHQSSLLGTPPALPTWCQVLHLSVGSPPGRARWELIMHANPPSSFPHVHKHTASEQREACGSCFLTPLLSVSMFCCKWGCWFCVPGGLGTWRWYWGCRHCRAAELAGITEITILLPLQFLKGTFLFWRVLGWLASKISSFWNLYFGIYIFFNFFVWAMGNHLVTRAAQHRRNSFPGEDAVSSLLDAMTFSRVRKVSEIWQGPSGLHVPFCKWEHESFVRNIWGYFI